MGMQELLQSAYGDADCYTKQKGEALSASGLVKIDDFGEKRILATASGTRDYAVRLANNGSLVWSCDCPQSKKEPAGMCKHIAALIRQSLDRFGGPAEKGGSLPAAVSKDLARNARDIEEGFAGLADPAKAKRLERALCSPYDLGQEALDNFEPALDAPGGRRFGQDSGQDDLAAELFRQNMNLFAMPNARKAKELGQAVAPGRALEWARVCLKVCCEISRCALEEKAVDHYGRLAQHFEEYASQIESSARAAWAGEVPGREAAFAQICAQALELPQGFFGQPLPFMPSGWVSELDGLGGALRRALEEKLDAAAAGEGALDALHWMAHGEQDSGLARKLAAAEQRPARRLECECLALRIEGKADEMQSLLARKREEGMEEAVPMLAEVALSSGQLGLAQSCALEYFQRRPGSASYGLLEKAGIGGRWEEALASSARAGGGEIALAPAKFEIAMLLGQWDKAYACASHEGVGAEAKMELLEKTMAQMPSKACGLLLSMFEGMRDQMPAAVYNRQMEKALVRLHGHFEPERWKTLLRSMQGIHRTRPQALKALARCEQLSGSVEKHWLARFVASEPEKRKAARRI